MHATKIVGGSALWMAMSAAAVAAPCAGFTDVESSDPFCHYVEWLKNRQITLGCAPALFCPNEAVSRLQTAAFLSRLSTALAPVVVNNSEAISITDGKVVCPTPAYYSADYPRVATANATLWHSAPTMQTVSGRLVVSNDSGSWVLLSPDQRTIASNPASELTTQSLVAGPFAVDHKTSVQFGILTNVLDAATSPITASCALSVRLENLTLPPPANN